MQKKRETWTRFATFSNRVSDESIDTYLYYRLLYPGYESWSEISIVQRSMESFKENTVVQNSAVDRNCVNCHAFNAQRPDDFLIHMRGSLGGTYFLKDGDLKKFQLKTKEMKNGAVYPRWHPSGKFVAFSSNKIIQQFHASNQNRIEVRDLNSLMMVYDVQQNEMFPARLDSSGQYMDTYPEWSPDGKFLYFCRAKLMKEEKDYKNIHYSLYRAAFDAQSRSFSKAELVVDAAANEKSISFPRISPNGKHLVFTFHDYGCFPIWHKEADLKMLNLESGKIVDFRANSDFSDSYHSWSQNGKWLIFSSKRGDGLTARPYIAFVDENGETSKAFVLPQESPDFYDSFLKTFNIPELANIDVHFNPAQLRKAAHADATQANYSTH